MASVFDRVIMAKSEITKGTDALPTVADAIQAMTADVEVNQTAIDIHVIKPTMGMQVHAQGKTAMTFKIKAEIKGSGIVDIPSEIAPLLKACYLNETITAGVDIKYTPTTRTPTPCTIYVYKDSKLFKGLGCVGNCVLTMDIAGIITADFTMRCLYTAPVVSALPVGAPVFDATRPIAVSNLDLTLEDGVSIRTSTFTLDLGNSVAEHYTTSYHEFTVADRVPVFNITKDTVASAGEWNALVAGNTALFDATFGQTALNTIQITAPNAVRETITYGVRSEKDIITVPYRAYEAAATGDDQFAIVFK
jgi:hypothetical protein